MPASAKMGKQTRHMSNGTQIDVATSVPSLKPLVAIVVMANVLVCAILAMAMSIGHPSPGSVNSGYEKLGAWQDQVQTH